MNSPDSHVRSVLVLVLVLLSSSTGRSQTPADDAREHYKKGTAAYNLGKYAEAAQEYELSYRATLDPALLFNVAQAYRLAGDRKKALTAYKSYLRSAPDGDKRELAEAKVHEIEAALNYDDPFAGDSVAPTSKPASSPPPGSPPAPELTTAGHSPIMDAAPPTSTASVLVTETSAPQAAPTSASFYQRWPFWAGVGVVAAAVVVLIVAESGSSSPQAPTTTYGTMRF